MELWTATQRQPPLYSKYGTIPGQTWTHMFKEKQHTPNFQHPLYEQKLNHEINWQTVPGSRTGWVMQDHTKRSRTRPPEFCFTLGSQPYSHGFSNQQGCERAERERAWAEMEKAQKERENERKMWRDGWGRELEPCSPFRYRRDCKRSMSDSSHRELEAWASRYYHSLPRRRCTESRMWGAQGFQRGQAQERERLPQWVGRQGSADVEGTSPAPIPIAPMGRRRQEEERHPAIPLKLPHYTFPKRSSVQDGKPEQSYQQQRVSSQPPSYCPPPPYCGPHYSANVALQLQKHPMKDAMSFAKSTLNQHYMQEGNNSTFVTPIKEEFNGDTRKSLQEKAWMEQWSTSKQLDLHCRPRHSGYKKRDGSLSPPKYLSNNTAQSLSREQPIIASELQDQTPPDSSKSVKTKLKKKRVRETIFCLVSRQGGVAGLSSCPEHPLRSVSLPLFSVQSPRGTEELRSEVSGESRVGFHLADEIDSKVTAQCQFSSPSRASSLSIPLPKLGSCSEPQTGHVWTLNDQEAAHREELFQVIQKRPRNQTRSTNNINPASCKDTEGSQIRGPQSRATPELSKKLQHTYGSVKLPIWKEPSLETHMGTSPINQYILGNWEKPSRAAEDQSHDKSDLSGGLCNYTTEGSIPEHKEATISDGSNGTLIIDATCVVVRTEYISPPKIELVQYPSGVQHPNPGPLNSGINSTLPTVTNELETTHVTQDFLLQENVAETDEDLERHRLESQEPDNEVDLTFQPEYPEEIDASNSISKKEAETNIECPNSSLSNLLNTEIPANETVEKRALRILGIPLSLFNPDETKSEDPSSDFVGHDTGKMQQPSSDLPSKEQRPEITHERQNEDQIYLQDSDTAEDNWQLDGVNNPGMETEDTCSQIKEPKSTELSAHESSEGDKANVCPEIRGIIAKEPASKKTVSSLGQVNQDASGQSEGVKHFPSTSECLNPAHNYGDSPPHSPPKSPTLMPSLGPLLSQPTPHTNNQLPVPSSASCLSFSRPDSCSSSPHSPLCPTYPSSYPPDSGSLAHFPSPPLSHFLPPPSSSYSVPFNLTSKSEHQGHQNLETSMETLPKSLSPQGDEPQRPKSLWDAVSRIRRHTAPDSENEEDEGGELWDHPDNAREGRKTKEALIGMERQSKTEGTTVGAAPQCQDLLQKISSGKSLKPDTELSGENVGLQEGRQGDVELGGQVDDETLSCSSSDSLASRDTVIMGKEEDREYDLVGCSEMRVETEAKQTRRRSLSCADETCHGSEKLPGAEDTGSHGKTLGLNKGTLTKECFGDGDETAQLGEMEKEHVFETSLEKKQDGELAPAISGVEE